MRRNILARMSATSRACRAGGIRRTTRHTDRRAALHRTRPRGKLNGEVARHTDILARIMARKLLAWNLSFRVDTRFIARFYTFGKIIMIPTPTESRTKYHHWRSSWRLRVEVRINGDGTRTPPGGGYRACWKPGVSWKCYATLAADVI